MNNIEFKKNRDLLDITQQEMAYRLGISAVQLRRYERDNAPIPDKIENKVIALLNKIEQNNAPVKGTLPLIPMEAVAGYGTAGEYSVTLNSVDEWYTVPDFERQQARCLIPVKGESMRPTYNSGDIVALRPVPQDYIQWNQVYVLDSITNGVLLKRIKQSKTKNCYLLMSDNYHYEPFDVPIKDIRNIFLVVGLIRV